MGAKRLFLGGIGALALGFLWMACSSSTGGTSCIVGAEGCACTSGGACDTGLVCLSSRCVKYGTTATTGAGGGGTAGSKGTGGAPATTGSTAVTTTTGGTSVTTGAGGAAGTPGTGGSGTGGNAAGGGITDGGRPIDASIDKGGSGGSSPAGTGGAPATGTGGTGPGNGGFGGAGGSGPPPGPGTLGAACKATGDCASGLSCIRSSDDLSAQRPGGVGNGICTRDCTADQTVCASIGGVCVAVDGGTDAGVTKAVCFESCAIGPNPPAAPIAKCHSRLDVTCEPVTPAETVFACIPICVTDADCGTRKCDHSSGLCDDTPHTGKSIGSGCAANAAQTSAECASGVCLPIETIPPGGTTPGICTELCRLGTQEACGYRITPLDAGPPMGACVLPWGDTGYNTGDLGLCLQLCDVPADCSYRASNWTCRTDITLRGFGHSVCLVPAPG